MAKNKYENSLYVGCALRHAPAEFKRDVNELKARLRKLGFNILEFVTDETASNVAVYQNDRECIDNCTAFLAIYDYPSLGLGGESATAARLGTPMLGVAHIDAVVSRWTLGEAEVHGYDIARYNHMLDDVPEIVIETFVNSGVLTLHPEGVS